MNINASCAVNILRKIFDNLTFYSYQEFTIYIKISVEKKDVMLNYTKRPSNQNWRPLYNSFEIIHKFIHLLEEIVKNNSDSDACNRWLFGWKPNILCPWIRKSKKFSRVKATRFNLFWNIITSALISHLFVNIPTQI